MGLFKELADETLYFGERLESEETYVDPNQLIFELDYIYTSY